MQYFILRQSQLEHTKQEGKEFPFTWDTLFRGNHVYLSKEQKRKKVSITDEESGNRLEGNAYNSVQNYTFLVKFSVVLS